jgi:hypothetical protein
VFSRLHTTDEAMLDALAAKDELGLRGTGTWVYDEQLGGVRLDVIPQEDADRLADEVAALVEAFQQISRHPRPPTEPSDTPDVPPLAAWESVVGLAKYRELILWSDDPLQRARARRFGLLATSTPAILAHLADSGQISASTYEDAIRSLVRARVGDIHPVGAAPARTRRGRGLGTRLHSGGNRPTRRLDQPRPDSGDLSETRHHHRHPPTRDPSTVAVQRGARC